ncbi:MAG TPA: C4-type zinc ribbon domain-containing protein [Arachnia sp.]|nr:C4-type zinc ribbon domain-containing protein [Arachnia sp.]HMT87747.1 C4-type zinc ribbon domain-containing protein [Arachnia sp.]
MLADPAAQLQLLTLADLDSEVARLRHAAQSLPQHKEIAALAAQRKEISDALISAGTEVDDLSVAVRRAESELAPVKARLARDETRIADGSVSDPKTLRGLTEEVEHLQRRIAELEDAELELMEQVEEATQRHTQLAAGKAEVETRLRALVAERDRAVAGLSAQAKQQLAKRPPLVAAVPDPLLRLYDKLTAKFGRGAARLERGRCGGCQLQLTAADLDAYRRAPANEVLRCVECDRILVRTKESGL